VTTKQTDPRAKANLREKTAKQRKLAKATKKGLIRRGIAKKR
jgi:hypothetical protein